VIASFLSLLTLATMLVAAFGLGRPLMRALGLGDEDALATGVWSIGAGLVLAGLGLALVGCAGLLYRPLIGVFTLAAGFWGVCEFGNAFSQRKAALPLPADGNAPATSLSAALTYAIYLLAGVAALSALVAALAPPTAGDALCYHLELPKRFLQRHALAYLPDTDNSTYPLLVEMWYLWALALDGPVGAQLVHWALGLLLALATVLLAAPLVGRGWASCAGGLMLLAPGITNQMTAPLNDVGLAAMTTLALAAWWRAAIDDEHPRWYPLAGLFFGGALAIKPLEILFGLSVLIVTAFLALRRGVWRSFASGTALALFVGLSVSGVWYARAAWHTGNPVYPFGQELLTASAPRDVEKTGTGSAPHDPALLNTVQGAVPVPFFSHTAPGRPTFPNDKAPLGRGFLQLVTAPWQITMHPERLGGRAHQLGILWLATLPGLIVCRRLRGLYSLGAIGGCYFAAWFFMRQNVRFLLPLLPLLATAAVWVWSEAKRLPVGPRRCLAAATALMLVASAAAAPLRVRDKLPVACGVESRDDYLSRREPTYPAASLANALATPGMRLLSQEHRAFYFDAPVIRESIYRRRTGYDRLLSADDLSTRLRQAGFTHLLLAESLAASGIRYNDTLSRLADAALSRGDGKLECLMEYRAADADGAVRRYRLMALR
jgi:hypothetical protein